MRYWTVLSIVVVVGLSAVFFKHNFTNQTQERTVTISSSEWVPTNRPGNRVIKVMRAVAARAVDQPFDQYQVGDFYLDKEGMLGRITAPDTVTYPADAPIPQRLAANILTVEEVRSNMPQLAEAIQNNLDHHWHHQCTVAARDAAKKRKQTIEGGEWTIVLHLEGDGTSMRIVGVSDGRGEWPSYFESEDKDCVRQSFYRPDAELVSWPWEKAEKLDVEYQLCIKLRSGEPQGDSALMHEHADELETENE